MQENLRTRRKRRAGKMTDFRQLSLDQMPSEVIYMISEYVTPREKSTLSQVNKHFRNLVNNDCQIWKNVTLTISPKRLDQCKNIVSLVKQRNIKSLSFATGGSIQIQKEILKELPELQCLSIPVLGVGTLIIVRGFCKKLKKLHVSRIYANTRPNYNHRIRNLPYGFEKVVRKLDSLEEMSLKGRALTEHAFPGYGRSIGNIIPYLKKLELSFHTLETDWFLGVLPLFLNLKSFKADVSNYSNEGHDYQITTEESQSFAIEEMTFHHALKPDLFLGERTIHLYQKCHNLVSLCLSYCSVKNDLKHVLDNLHKLPALRKLKLINCAINNDMLPYLPDLQQLDLEGSWKLTRKGIESLALKCPSLTYLGLATCSRLKEDDFELLPSLLPHLDTLDVSRNQGFTNEVLKKFYLQSCHSTPHPRKIIAKDCRKITYDIIKLATENFQHQLKIIP